METEDLKKYIKENLKINIDYISSYDLQISLLLEDEIISIDRRDI